MYDAVLVKVDDGLHDRSQVVTRCMNKNTGDIVNYLDKFADDNYLDKFADDTYLIVPSSQRHTVHDELDLCLFWPHLGQNKQPALKHQQIQRVDHLQTQAICAPSPDYWN